VASSVNKAPTLVDVARRAGVHTATASRALNPATRDLLSAKTVRRVVAAAAAIGYSPNAIARALRTARTRSVGVLIPDLTNPIFPPMVRGIEDALRDDLHTALLADTDNDFEKEADAIAALQERHVDGLLVATARRRHPLLEQLLAANTPIVGISRTLETPAMAAVVPDDANGITEAFSHLRQLGHRHIGHLAGPQDMSTGMDRARAFSYCASSAGLADACPVVECEQYARESGAGAMEVLLASDPGVTAVVAGNDLIALGALETIRRSGRRCPDDVSVVGFNDMPYLDLMSPPLTTVRVSHYDLGFEAARMLVQMLRRPSANRRLVLPTQLVVRQSTAAPPASTARPRSRRRQPAASPRR
jgi:LacI family transcriptional regulator